MSGGDAPSDAVLVGRAVEGDARAFAAIVSRHKAPLYRFIRRYVGNDDDAYDLLQQTYVSAWSSLSRYDPERSLRTWLHAIALNKCRDHARKLKVRRLFFGTGASAAVANVADPQPNAERLLIRDERERALAAAIVDLPRQLKEPLLLTVFGAMTQAEAGRQLGISVKAVETRMARARRRLAQALEHVISGSKNDEL